VVTYFLGHPVYAHGREQTKQRKKTNQYQISDPIVLKIKLLDGI